MDTGKRELAARVREGDQEAFAEMMRLHAGEVLRHARSMLGHGGDADDAAQEVFIRAYRHRQSLRGENIRAWLGTITHRQCLDHLTRKGRDPLLPGELPETRMSSATTAAPSSEGEPLSLACLTPVEREVLLLRVVEELSYRDIAEMTGMTEGSLRNIHARALSRLREEHRR